MTAARSLRVGFIGTGLMGGPMAARLVDAGLAVTVWNRTATKAEALVKRGASWADSPAELARRADILILMLTDAAAVDDVLDNHGVAHALRPNALVVNMSSIAPDASRAHAHRLAGGNVAHLDAPVSGGVRGATSGTLAIMVGGADLAFAQAFDVLSVLGRPTYVGPPGAGQIAKLANQTIVAITIGAVAEALFLAQSAGADAAAVQKALAGGFADSRILQEHGTRMLEGNFTPGGTVRNQIKDLDAALSLAQAHALQLPMLVQARERFTALAELGFGGDDHSAVFKLLTR